MSTIEYNTYFSLLPMGRTGVGKSSFLNLLCGSQIFETNAKAKACTKEVTGYEFRFDEVFLTAINAPGLDDGDGNDQQHMDQLTDFLAKRKHGLNAVAIVISNSNYRLDASLKKAIKQLYRFFGNGNFWYHVCVIVTHCTPFPDDIAELRKSMTTGPDSLHSEMVQMIKDVCNLGKCPAIPFYFFDSKHPNNYPTNESLPKFKEWLKSRGSFKTCDLKKIDLSIQYQEKRQEVFVMNGPKKPIFKFIPGQPRMITIEENVPYITYETVPVEVEREYVDWVNRKWDFGDYITLGILRLFRDNKVKVIRKRKEIIHETRSCTKYRKESKQIFSGEYGKDQKILKGYYQETTKVTETYIAIWTFESKDDDVKNRTNPIMKKNCKKGKGIISVCYFDEYGKKLDPNIHINKINDLIKLKGIYE